MISSRAFMFASSLALLAACGGGSNVTGTGGGGGGGCTGTNASVDVCDNKYSPNSSTISAGTSITWTWKGSNSHSVTFQTGPALVGTGSSTQTTGTFTQMFTTPGTYTYECVVHGSAMSGTITVN